VSSTLVSDMLTVFVATTLVNPTNAREHWSLRSKRAKAQRDLVAAAVWSALRDPRSSVAWRITAKPNTPKAIILTAYVARKFDDDGLQDCGLIHSDGPSSDHVFTYWQVVDKTKRGVMITVMIREPVQPTDPGAGA